VLFFNRKTCYYVYADDAEFIAREYFKTSTGMREVGKAQMKCQAVMRGQLPSIARDLVHDKAYKFEIWGTESAGSNSWTCTHKVSPGNLQGLDELFKSGNNTDANDTVTIAIAQSQDKGQNLIGVALCDVNQHVIHVAEFIDTIHYTNLESVLVQAPGVRECLLAASTTKQSSSDPATIPHILARCSILQTTCKRSDFSTRDIEQDLQRLLGQVTNNLNHLEWKTAMSACACVIKYLELLGDDSNFSKFTMKELNLKDKMRLDSAAIEALKLLPSRRDLNKKLNLYGLLNRCVTVQGSRELTTWIRQPLMKLDEIRLRTRLVTVFHTSVELREALRTEYLKFSPDFSRIISRLQRGLGKLEDCCKIHQFFRLMPDLLEMLQNYRGPDSDLVRSRYTNTLQELSEVFTTFCALVEEVVDMQEAEQNRYMIQPEFDGVLLEWYNAMRKLETSIHDHHDDVKRQLSKVKTFQLHRSAQFGYCFKVSRKDEKLLKASRVKYQTVDTRKDGVKFKTTALKELADEYETAYKTYQEKQKDLIAQFMETVLSYQEPLLEVSYLVTEVDILSAWAHVFATSAHQYVAPTLTEAGAGDIILKDARHPCLELQDVDFIPNDVALRRDTSSFQIITGPNMGGKSTYIRSVGVIVLMAQLGCYVPCRAAQVSIVDAILCRVGAGDSQSRGVSTFMAEMIETTAILETATSRSLIIVDELGRGTSTYDGFGIAWAISEHICTKIGAFCFFATHFHELTTLEKKFGTVKNMHVSARARENDLVLLYKVEEQACDQSFGIHVAEMANFPAEVVAMAKRKASELENFDDTAAPSPSKKKKMAEGEQLHGYVQRFCEIDFECPRDAVTAQLTNLRQEMAANAASDPQLAALLS